MELKNFFAQDGEGNVVPGATGYLYEPGTTTLVTGVKDKDGADLANPMTATSQGLFQFAAPDGDYDFRVVGAGRDVTLRVRFADGAAVAASAATAVAYAEGIEPGGPGTKSAKGWADEAEISAAYAEEFSGPAYETIAAGEAATTAGQFFRVSNGDTPRTYTRYQRTTGGSVVAAPLATTKSLENLNYKTSQQNYSVPADDTSGGRFASRSLVTNPTGLAGQAHLKEFRQDGVFTSGSNTINETWLTGYKDVRSGYGWGQWNAIWSPLNPSSGFVGAPGGTQAFNIVARETNPQNRHGNTSWYSERRLFPNATGGEQMVAETQDFPGQLSEVSSGGYSNKVRVGYSISFAYAVAKSPYTSTLTNRHATFSSAMLVDPNSIAPNGFAITVSGYKRHVTGITLASGGTGYTVRDVLKLNTGLDASYNNDARVRVLAVDGTGTITSAELWMAGDYTDALPAGPLPVTGGSGSGATFNYTLSVQADEAPRSVINVIGTWLGSVIDLTTYSNSSLYGYVGSGVIRVPPNTVILAGLNGSAVKSDILTWNGTSAILMGALNVSSTVVSFGASTRLALPNAASSDPNSVFYDSTRWAIGFQHAGGRSYIRGDLRGTLSSRPTASVDRLNARYTVEGTGSLADVTYECMRVGSGPTYDWVPVAGVVMTSIASTPQFVGQKAVVGGVIYMAAGTSSSADWKQISN